MWYYITIGNGKALKQGERMILIACIDDDNGMMFNNRRQSRDRELTGRIRELTAAGTLHVQKKAAGTADNHRAAGKRGRRDLTVTK